MNNLRRVLLIFSLFLLSYCFHLAKDKSSPNCRFAKEYTAESLLQDPENVYSFLRSFVSYEANFIRLAIDPKTGFTYDGIRVDVDSGIPLEDTLHRFTASSKECIHLAIMAKVLNGDEYSDEIYNAAQVFRLIQLKINALEKFYTKYPGFAGYLPWVLITEDGLTPAQDFTKRVPALDNGEMFWAALLLSRVWQKKYPNVLPQVRSKFDELFWKGMIRNSRKVFFNQTTSKIRAVADIEDPSLPLSQNTYTNNDNYYLDDPYEGEMFTWMITLFCKDQFSEKQIDFLWADKRNKLQSTSLEVKSQKRNITVQKGWWYSSHQQWKLLFLPYWVSPTYKRVMVNNERARAWNSIQKGIPGMYGCEAGPASKNQEDTGYFCSGIPEISFQKAEFNSLVTPYGVFPLLLVNQTLGTIWLHNSIRSPAGQTQFGALEGTGLNGSLISPVLTWDTKVTAALAAMGGLQQFSYEMFQQEGLLQQFASRIERQYKSVFSTIEGEDLPIPLPNKKVTQGRPDFTTCQ